MSELFGTTLRSDNIAEKHSLSSHWSSSPRMFTHRGITVDLFLVRIHPVDYVYRSYWVVMSVFYIALSRAVCGPRTTLTPCPLLNSVLKLRHLCSISLSDVILLRVEEFKAQPPSSAVLKVSNSVCCSGDEGF